jgi:flavin reductase (DIM6/NTAB) family NADH-FMN oxidoreductase RutF
MWFNIELARCLAAPECVVISQVLGDAHDVLVVGVEDYAIPGLPDNPENGDARGVGSRLGEQGSAQSASAVCLTVVGGACPDNRRAHSCSKRGHI